MPLKVSSEFGSREMIAQEVRLPGWSEERYFEEAPENGFFELKDGELIMHSPVNLEHQRVVGFLHALLRAYAGRQNLGEVFAGPAVLRLRPDLNREPDLFFVGRDRSAQINEQHVDAPVELVIEVTSPDSENRDLYEKRDEYEAAGVEEYWVVDLSTRRVAQHTREAGRFQAASFTKGRVESQAVPGFWILAEWLWERPLPEELACLDQILKQD